MDNFKMKFDLLCDEFLSNGNSQNQLNILLTKAVPEKKKSRYSSFNYFVVAIVLLLLCGYCYYETMDDVTMKLVMPFVCPILRFIRIVSLPVSTRTDLTALYDGDCLVWNPYFDRTPNCLSCQGTLAFSERDGMPSSHDDVSRTEPDNYIIPQLYKNCTTPVSLSEFLDTCTRYLDTISTGIHGVNCTNFKDFAHFADGLKNNRREFLQDELFHMEWKTQLIGPARIFRKLFRRPTFVDVSHEIHVEKLILIDGSESGPTEINFMGSASAAYYTQASGSRILSLVPNQACKECATVSVTVSSGDIVHVEYNEDWRLITNPVIPGSNSLAIVQTYNTS